MILLDVERASGQLQRTGNGKSSSEMWMLKCVIPISWMLKTCIGMSEGYGPKTPGKNYRISCNDFRVLQTPIDKMHGFSWVFSV